jgi:serine phosphatase RsbU (regulator of sigma subunit)
MRRIGPFHAIPLVVLALLVGVTTVGAIVTGAVIRHQERMLLSERANEVTLVLSTSISTVSTDLSVLARDAGRKDPALFVQEAQAELTGSRNPAGVGLLRPAGQSFVVVASAGQGLPVGEVLSGAPAHTMTIAQRRPTMVATGVYGSGSSRSLGFALGAQDGLVVYRQTILGRVHPPAQARTAPFSELHVVLYGSARPDPSQVLTATSNALPLTGTVIYVPLMAGSTKWLTAVAAAHPLVGSVASAAPWLVLGAGLLLSFLVFLLLETMAYRRDNALQALESEHRFAEALQFRLLPTLPTFPGLDVASTYVTGADDQQVGGDWFDVFELPSGQVALAIGDVMGHDVDAAATMGQVRSALRSYAVEGGDPARVVAQLARFLELFAISALVTVVYGLLDLPGPDGSRCFRWANAGHLPPLLRHPNGQVEELAEPSSPLLGAPSTEPRLIGETRLELNATLFLYTDGLVEGEGQDLGGNVRELQAVLGRADPTAVQDVCAAVLDSQLPGSRRDDVALLVVKVTEMTSRREPATKTVTATTPRRQIDA